MEKAFEGIGDASTAIRKFLIQNEDKLPDHLRDRLSRLTDTGTSPVDLTVTFVEAVYANQRDFKAEAKKLAAAAAVVCETFGFHGMNEGQRGSKVAKILTGEKMAKAHQPEAKADLQTKPEEPADETSSEA